MFHDTSDLRTDEILLRLTRTCELAGGEFVEIAPIPEDNEMYAEGKRLVKVYRFAL